MIEPIAENLWVLRYPLPLLGADFGRTVSVIRLPSGKLVIHSTGPFTPADVAAIRALGEPGWLVEATNVHDTFAAPGHAAFPDVPYFGPPGFSRVAVGIPAQLLSDPPPEWAGTLDVLPLGGVPRVREHAFFHRPSRTLIVADLLFNVGPSATAWTRFLVRWVAGLKAGVPGVSRIFRKLAIRDPAALRASLEQMLAWDFDRVIVAHGDIIASDGKRRLTQALAAAGLAG